MGRPPRTSPFRAWVSAAGAGGPGRLLQLADVPGNVLVPARSTGLPRDSVVNVSQILTLDRSFMTEHAGTLPPRLQGSVDEGLRTVLQL